MDLAIIYSIRNLACIRVQTDQDAAYIPRWLENICSSIASRFVSAFICAKEVSTPAILTISRVCVEREVFLCSATSLILRPACCDDNTSRTCRIFFDEAVGIARLQHIIFGAERTYSIFGIGFSELHVIAVRRLEAVGASHVLCCIGRVRRDCSGS